jgi:hypothetical protein
VGLYRKAGFAAEGIKRHSLCIEGRYADELFMSKLIDATPHAGRDDRPPEAR